MADKKCNPCEDNLFKTISSNVSLQELIDAITEEVGTGSNTTVSAGNSISVVKTTVGDTDNYEVSYNPYLPLTVNLTNNQSLLLKGVTLSTFTLDWTFNKGVVSQSLDQGLTAPAVINGQKVYSLTPTGQAITTNTTFTLTADDVTGDTNNPITDTTSIQFGNYIYQTQIAISDRANIDASVINALTLTALTKTIKTNKSLTFAALSDSTEYEAIFVPTAFNVTGGANFKDLATNFTGGWGKVLTLELTNEAGFAEDYDIFISSNKNLQGLTFQII